MENQPPMGGQKVVPLGLPPAGLGGWGGGGGKAGSSPFSEGLGIETTDWSRLSHREA